MGRKHPLRTLNIDHHQARAESMHQLCLARKRRKHGKFRFGLPGQPEPPIAAIRKDAVADAAE